MLEIFCYLIIFLEQSESTKKVSRYLNETTVKARDRMNAISLSGQFLTWAAGSWYIVLGLIISATDKTDRGRELAAVVRLSQFGIIPAIEIVTSPPLKRFAQSLISR